MIATADYPSLSERPRVSVIVTAYNLAGYLPAALDSALAQEDCGGPLQIIVVDDGSTDDTPRVLERYADRVEVIRKPNGGLVSAVDRGLQAVLGEYVALLDADDEWPRDRLRRHVEILDARPEVGLVHGDMEVIDATGRTLHPSFFAWKRDVPTDGRVLARLTKDNFVSGGASTFRASLMPAISPISPEAAYPDWWIATNIATVSEIVFEPGNANRYRYHGANMGLGADRPALLAIERRELPFRRWVMRNLVADDTINLAQLGELVLRWRAALAHAGLSAGGSVRGVLDVDIEAASVELAAARALPVGRARCNALVRALAFNPFDGATAVDLEIAFMQAAEAELAPASDPAPPLILLDTKPQTTIAWLDELLAEPELLRSFALGALAADGETLVILHPREADLTELVSLAQSDPVYADDRCDLQAVIEPASTPARGLLAARACAVLSRSARREPFDVLPVHSAVRSYACSASNALAT